MIQREHQTIVPPPRPNEVTAGPSSPPTCARKGKVARLPKPTRDLINRMLDDGLPYHVIIDELGEAGQGLNAQNLTNWKQGGYQDWLKHQDVLDRSRLQMEFAADLLREIGGDASQIHATCQMLAAVQMFAVIYEHGDEALKKFVLDDPVNYLRLLNTVCNLSHSSLKLEKHRLAIKAGAAVSLSSSLSRHSLAAADGGEGRGEEGPFNAYQAKSSLRRKRSLRPTPSNNPSIQ